MVANKCYFSITVNKTGAEAWPSSQGRSQLLSPEHVAFSWLFPWSQRCGQTEGKDPSLSKGEDIFVSLPLEVTQEGIVPDQPGFLLTPRRGDSLDSPRQSVRGKEPWPQRCLQVTNQSYWPVISYQPIWTLYLLLGFLRCNIIICFHLKLVYVRFVLFAIKTFLNNPISNILE